MTLTFEEKKSEHFKLTIMENFLEFMTSKNKTGLGLVTEVLTKIENDGLDISSCRT